jgi:imidazolonepropionase-like amidohydrolase
MRGIASFLVASFACGLVASGQQSSTAVALVGARIIDGTGAAPIPDAALLVSNGRIEGIGPAASLRMSSAVMRIDVAGRTIIPGLINSHGHLNNGDRSLPLYDQIIQQLLTYARFGVTTVYALGDDGKESVRVRDENHRAPLDRARLYAAGPSTVGKTREEARRLVAERHAQGVRFLKTRLSGNANDMTPDVYAALIDEAHRRDIKVASHLFHLSDARGLVNAGVDVIAHSIRDRDVDAAFVAEVKKRNVGYIPTLTRDLSVFQYTRAPDYLTDPFFLRGESLFAPQIARVKDPALHAKTQASPGAQSARRGLDQALRNLKLLSDAGVTIAMGTDSGTGTGRWQGYFEHVELELMVKAGMTPMQVLRAATGNAAKVMGLDAELGTLQPGKRADFLVLTSDPLADIRNTRAIDAVWIDGRRLH